VSHDTDRGQLVLLAAVAFAVALAGVTVAYLQLGYHADVDTRTGHDPAQQVTRTLDRSLHNATTDVATTYRWQDRTNAAAIVRQRLDSTLETLRTAQLADGHVYDISYNGTRAETWAQDDCPDGPDRQFGSCDCDDGIVLQDRNGRTHVLGVAVDIVITTPQGETTVTTVRLLTYVEETA
jgi:hypothetical protein